MVPEEREETQALPASVALAGSTSKEVSIWVYAWVVLVLLVGGTIVYIRKYA